MHNYGLTGFPLGHSVSPQIHKRLFALSGLSDCEYALYPLAPEEFQTGVEQLKQLSGFNVTIPYKQAIIPHLNELDETAKRYGAVNTVCRNPSGLKGYNTDVVGFLRSLSQLGAALPGADVLLLGYGGAGRMMGLEAAHQGARSVTIAARETSIGKASLLAQEISEKYPHCGTRTCALEEVEGRFSLICNSTPCGMYPNAGVSPLSEQALSASSGGFLFDAIYNPGETELMRLARKNGIRALGGMSMLVWQAAAAQEIWYGAHFSQQAISGIVTDMEQLIRAEF